MTLVFCFLLETLYPGLLLAGNSTGSGVGVSHRKSWDGGLALCTQDSVSTHAGGLSPPEPVLSCPHAFPDHRCLFKQGPR